jgi:hypothetical protein
MRSHSNRSTSLASRQAFLPEYLPRLTARDFVRATYFADRSWTAKFSEEHMADQEDKKPLKPKADGQSHKPAKHIEETARLASSVETAKDPGKVRGD